MGRNFWVIPVTGWGVKKSYACASMPSDTFASATTAGRSWRITLPGKSGNFFLISTHCWPVPPPMSTNTALSVGHAFASSPTFKKLKQFFTLERCAYMKRLKCVVSAGCSWSHVHRGWSVLKALWKGVSRSSVGFCHFFSARNSGIAWNDGPSTSLQKMRPAWISGTAMFLVVWEAVNSSCAVSLMMPREAWWRRKRPSSTGSAPVFLESSSNGRGVGLSVRISKILRSMLTLIDAMVRFCNKLSISPLRNQPPAMETYGVYQPLHRLLRRFKRIL